MSDNTSFLISLGVLFVAFCGVPCCWAFNDWRNLEKTKTRIAGQISPEAFSDFKNHIVSNRLKLELYRVFRSGNKSMSDFLEVAKAERADVLVACIRMIQVGTIEHV
jgi:hypothetical protein